MRAALERWVLARWHGRPGLLLVLLPLSWLYRAVVAWRSRRRNPSVPPVPVIVVGNITVGGAGKTPLVIAFVQALRARGFRPGVISRGYGGAGPFPLWVSADTPPSHCGDEPVLIASVTGVPLVVAPDRLRALAMLVDAGVDVAVSDDGLQHVALPRTVEIVVIDHRRRLGNGHCLPVGPLREPAVRLDSVDFIVGNGGDAGVGAVPMRLRPTRMHDVAGVRESLDVQAFRREAGQRVAAVAGIGDPSRFFATLREAGFDVVEYPFPDHHAFDARDFAGMDPSMTLVMTAKDAVKCRHIVGLSAWYLAVEADLPASFFDAVVTRAGLHGRSFAVANAEE